MHHYIGIDIGGTKIAGGIVASDGTVLNRLEAQTPVKEGGPRILAAAIELCRSLMLGRQVISAIGIGAGGQINSDQGSVYSATDVLPGWRGLAVAPPGLRRLSIYR